MGKWPKKTLEEDGVVVSDDFRVDLNELIWCRSEMKTVFIVGPTASGKSALAMRIAQKFNGEIICADSQTVRRRLNIGTAKPTLADRKLIPHHLLDIIDPYQRFTAADFKRLAVAAISDIRSRGKLPLWLGARVFMLILYFLTLILDRKRTQIYASRCQDYRSWSFKND